MRNSERNQNVPRRNMIPEWCEAEKLIQDAIWAIEKMGADTRLTDAQTMLSQAKDKVSDYYDEQLDSNEQNN